MVNPMLKAPPFRTPHIAIAALAGAGLLAAIPSGAQAAVSIFQGLVGNAQGTTALANFNAAAGSPPISISFDSLAGGDIAGTTIAGVTFSSPTGNTLEVVNAADTFTPGEPTRTLGATSGAKVLSPGGTSLTLGNVIAQRDSLRLDFATPQSAFALDILYQSYDFASFTSYAIFNSSLTQIASGSVSTNLGGSGGAPPGAHFFGVTSDALATNFSRIVFTESDGDTTNPDANIGYDSFRFVAATAAIPEPRAWALMIAGFGLAGGALRRRREARA